MVCSEGKKIIVKEGRVKRKKAACSSEGQAWVKMKKCEDMRGSSGGRGAGRDSFLMGR